jgi:dipeptidyl-peptidase-3
MKDYICPCCGVKKTFDDAEVPGVEERAEIFCQPCVPLLSTHSIPSATPVVVLDASEAFDLLSDKEKMYAYWMGQASWKGSLICLTQCSPESMAIFTILLAAFSAQPIEELLEKARGAGFEQCEIDDLLMYSAAFFNNMGNYKSFGDTKFVPLTPKERFRAFLLCSSLDATVVNKLFDDVETRMYSLQPRHRQVQKSFYLRP